jgi:hypothetical protein
MLPELSVLLLTTFKALQARPDSNSSSSNVRPVLWDFGWGPKLLHFPNAIRHNRIRQRLCHILKQCFSTSL